MTVCSSVDDSAACVFHRDQRCMCTRLAQSTAHSTWSRARNTYGFYLAGLLGLLRWRRICLHGHGERLLQ